MFCTQCGTQIDQGKNFCKNCGARVGPPAERASSEGEGKTGPVAPPTETAAPSVSAESFPRRAQPMPVSPPRGRAGSNKLVVVAAGIAVLVLGAVGIYFGTDLFRSADVPAPARIAEPLAKATEAPPLPSFEETKDGGSGAGDSATSVNPPLPPEPAPPPAPIEPPKLPLETLPKAAPRAEVPARPKSQRAGQEPSSGRINRPPPSAPVSRGGATPGIYETLRTTTVYEDPSASSKVLASIAAGTRVNVVSSNGEWLEVHSRRGNPPGFIRRNDATLIEKTN